MSVINLGGLLKSSDNADVTLIVGPEGTVMKAHSIILTYSSEFMKKALHGDFKVATRKEIKLPEQRPETIKRILDFMYTGEYTSTTIQEDADVFLVAVYLQIENLKPFAIIKFSGKLELDPVWARMRVGQPTGSEHSSIISVIDQLYQNTADADRRIENWDRMLNVMVAHFHNIFKLDDFHDLLSRNRDLLMDVMKNYHEKMLAGATFCESCCCLSKHYGRCGNFCERPDLNWGDCFSVRASTCQLGRHSFHSRGCLICRAQK